MFCSQGKEFASQGATSLTPTDMEAKTFGAEVPPFSFLSVPFSLKLSEMTARFLEIFWLLHVAVLRVRDYEGSGMSF